MASGISGNGGGSGGSKVTFRLNDGGQHNTQLLRNMERDIRELLQRLKRIYLETNDEKKLAVRTARQLGLITDILLASTSGVNPVVNINDIKHVCSLMGEALSTVTTLESRQVSQV